ncbi:MAG: MBL fold metallo-hydrolase [Dehalococcoidales bacterium]|jgi:glyoxylase-like metal-dependent hydrolase (beta-lactamase superfamily II)|nr:MBL fold metallo-hydrolase [Dehalococcoidales bacterium]MDP7525785.1 MBL fold metallo-hydrolase [Dehalococcoidales bacterium]
MAKVSEVSDGIYLIDMGEVKGAGSKERLNCSLVYFMVDGEQTALIETSPGAVVPIVLEAIKGLGHDPARLSSVILTHIHLDHAGGVGRLAQQFPQLKVIVHEQGARHLTAPAMLITGTKQAYSEEFEADYGPIIAVPEEQVEAVKDGDTIRLGDRELKVIYTPGHAPHHMSIYDTRSQGLFSGDSLGHLTLGSNPIVIVAGFDLGLALESIDKMSDLDPRRVYASHGSSDREAAEFIRSVRATTSDYGEIILTAMKAGEDEAQMIQRLEAYNKEHDPDDKRDTRHRFEAIIPWYVAYFKKKQAV